MCCWAGRDLHRLGPCGLLLSPAAQFFPKFLSKWGKNATWWFTDGQSSYGQLLVYSKEVMFRVPGIIGPPKICQYEPKNHRLLLKKFYFSWRSPYFVNQGSYVYCKEVLFFMVKSIFCQTRPDRGPQNHFETCLILGCPFFAFSDFIWKDGKDP